MSAIPDNAIVTVSVADAQTVAGLIGALNSSDVLSAVSAYLNGLGNYQVEATQSSGDIASTISPLIQETFQATLSIQVFSSEDTSQLSSDVQAAFAFVTGQTPTQITIPSYTPPGGAATPTGQVAPTPTAAQSASNAASSATSAVANTISSFFTQLTSTAKSLLIGLAAVIIIVVALIAFGPNVGSIVNKV
jgi:hypothetical protein